MNSCEVADLFERELKICLKSGNWPPLLCKPGVFWNSWTACSTRLRHIIWSDRTQVHPSIGWWGFGSDRMIPMLVSISRAGEMQPVSSRMFESWSSIITWLFHLVSDREHCQSLKVKYVKGYLLRQNDYFHVLLAYSCPSRGWDLLKSITPVSKVLLEK